MHRKMTEKEQTMKVDVLPLAAHVLLVLAAVAAHLHHGFHIHSKDLQINNK